MFLKAYDLLLSLGKNLNMIRCEDDAVPAFANKMSLKSNFFDFLTC